MSGEDRYGDILSPRRGVASAAEKHLEVGDEGRKLAELSSILDVPLLLSAERRRMRLPFVLFFQVRGEEAEFAERQVRSAE